MRLLLLLRASSIGVILRSSVFLLLVLITGVRLGPFLGLNLMSFTRLVYAMLGPRLSMVSKPMNLPTAACGAWKQVLLIPDV